MRESAKADQRVVNAIAFPVGVSEDPVIEVVEGGDPPHVSCPGSFCRPSARTGYPCVYELSDSEPLGTLGFYPTYGGGRPARAGPSVYAQHESSSTLASRSPS